MELVHENDKNDQDIRRIEMENRSLLVLSGESRYNWRHRVLPIQETSRTTLIQRISVVLGVQ